MPAALRQPLLFLLPPPLPLPRRLALLCPAAEGGETRTAPPPSRHGRHPQPGEDQRVAAHPAQRRRRVLQGGRAALRPEPHHQAAHRGQVQDRHRPPARHRPGHVSASKAFIFRGLRGFPGRLTARGFRDFSLSALSLPRCWVSGQPFPCWLRREAAFGSRFFPLSSLRSLLGPGSFSPSFPVVCPGGRRMGSCSLGMLPAQPRCTLPKQRPAPGRTQTRKCPPATEKGFTQALPSSWGSSHSFFTFPE